MTLFDISQFLEEIQKDKDEIIDQFFIICQETLDWLKNYEKSIYTSDYDDVVLEAITSVKDALENHMFEFQLEHSECMSYTQNYIL